MVGYEAHCKGGCHSSFGGIMGDSYRDAIRKQGKGQEDASVSRAIARSASKARAKVRAQHARVARSRFLQDYETLPAFQARMNLDA